jgi:hypothetical protein
MHDISVQPDFLKIVKFKRFLFKTSPLFHFGNQGSIRIEVDRGPSAPGKARLLPRILRRGCVSGIRKIREEGEGD